MLTTRQPLEGLITFNEKIMGEPRDKNFSVFLKDDAGSVFGEIQAHLDIIGPFY